MKKIIAMLLVVALCLGLCACGGNEESIELPTKPAQSAVGENLPSTGETQNTASGEVQESTEPAVETYPWEAEFREEEYTRFSGGAVPSGDKVVFEGDPAPNGDKAVTWLEGEFLDRKVRELYTWGESGDVLDRYFYPSGNTSHEYMRYADGTYVEFHYLDNGYVDLENQMTHTGTQIYYKRIEPDGSESEQFSDENGNLIRIISKTADGTYSESCYFENGNIKKSVSDDSETGIYFEQEYFENGNLKFSKSQSPEYVSEERYDEEGYHTYLYTKTADWEMECIADESGKLIKYVENGTVYENDAIPDWVAGSYNFRG